MQTYVEKSAPQSVNMIKGVNYYYKIKFCEVAN